MADSDSESDSESDADAGWDWAAAKIVDKLPPQVAEKYALWCAVVRQSGPAGLREIKGFHDEKLAGKLAHLRSSRLSQQWGVLYR